MCQQFCEKRVKRKHQSPSVHTGRLGSFSYLSQKKGFVPLPNTHIYKIAIRVLSVESQIEPARPEAILV